MDSAGRKDGVEPNEVKDWLNNVSGHGELVYVF